MEPNRAPAHLEGVLLDGGATVPVDDRTAVDAVLFDDLYRLQYAPMVRLALALVGSVALAEELVQESFVRVYERFATVEHPEAYLRKVIVNACRSHHRRLRLERDRSPNPLPDAAPVEVAELWHALAVLPPRQREVVVLRFYEDLSEAETAAVLGCRPGTVKSRTARALARLREVVER